MGCSPAGTDCFGVGPSQGHKSCQQICSSVGFSLHGSTGPAKTLLQCRLSMGSQTPLGISTCSTLGSSMDCRWISAPPWTSMGCRGTVCLNRTACLIMVFTTGCMGISALVPGAPPPPPSSLTLVSAKSFLSHILIPLFRLLLHSSSFPLLKYVSTEALSPLLMSLALASSRSVLEPAGTGSVGHGGSFSQKPPLQSPTTKTLPRKPDTTSYSTDPESLSTLLVTGQYLCRCYWANTVTTCHPKQILLRNYHLIIKCPPPAQQVCKCIVLSRLSVCSQATPFYKIRKKLTLSSLGSG